MKASALVVFLLLFLTSVIAHAEHLVFQEISAEQQDCHLCNQGIDTPPELPQVQATSVTRFDFVTSQKLTQKLLLNDFVQPPSRAPPVIQ